MGLDFIKRLTPVEYKWINNAHNRTHMGFVAEDLYECLDGKNYSVYVDGKYSMKESEKEKNKDKELKGIRYTELLAPLVKSVQELSNIVKDQQTEIADLKKLVNMLINK